MGRALRTVLILSVVAGAVMATVGLATAEQGGTRVIILPLRGPGGLVARNEIASRIEPSVAYVKRIGTKGAQRPARTARMHKADAMIGGRIRCPGKMCAIDVVIYRRTGQIWTKGAKRASRANLGTAAADLTESLLEQIGAIDEGGGEEDDYDEGDEGDDYDEGDEGDEGDEDDEFDMDAFEEPERRPRRSDDHDFDALEIYLDANLTVVRNLCVDLSPETQNDVDCNLNDPTYDDRTYTVSPYANMGFRLNVFPGSFVRRRQWWSHIGLYADYSHSLSVSSQREYETPDPEARAFTVEIPTMQQDLRIGLMYRLAIPTDSPTGPQLRFMVGYGMYEFALDDRAYPAGSDIRIRYRDSNPYLPSFKYHSFDLGLQFRLPIQEFLFPYTSIAYRAGLSSGQAERVYGSESSVNGVDWELGLIVEVGVGIRFYAAVEVIWYGTTFAGAFSPEDEEEGEIWGVNSETLGDSASDTVFRLRFGAGWSF